MICKLLFLLLLTLLIGEGIANAQVPQILNGNQYAINDACKVYQAENPHAFDSLIQHLANSARKAWKPPRMTSSQHAKFLLEVNSEGTILGFQLKQGTQNAKFNASLIKALANSLPAKGFPKNSPCKEITIELNFDYDLINPRQH